MISNSTSTSTPLHVLSSERRTKEKKDTKHLLEVEEDSVNGPTNEYVLNFAFVSFMFFVIFEGVFAVIAKSESMMADAQAMGVDAFTYLFNLMAEKKKKQLTENNELSDQKSEEEKQLEFLDKKIQMLYLELIPPSISVVILVGVSMQAFCEAMKKLFSTEKVPISEQSNVVLMFVFSGMNLLIDLFNMLYFSQLKNFNKQLNNLFHSNGLSQDLSVHDFPQSPKINQAKYDGNHDENALLLDPQSQSKVYGENCEIKTLKMKRFPEDEESNQDDICETDRSDDSKNILNLNMCSAYTHVMADTLRSVTVVVTSSLAICFEQINGDQADAIGAVVVSFIIAISLGPLLAGIASIWSELLEQRALRKNLLVP